MMFSLNIYAESEPKSVAHQAFNLPWVTPPQPLLCVSYRFFPLSQYRHRLSLDCIHHSLLPSVTLRDILLAYMTQY